MSKKKKGNIIKKLDGLWSLYIRKRDRYTCQKCGKRDKHTQAAHIFSRNNKSIRWDPDNGITLCYYCHIIWAHRNPVEFTMWIREKIGEEKFSELERKSREIIYDIDYNKIEKKLKRLLKEVEEDD